MQAIKIKDYLDNPKIVNKKSKHVLMQQYLNLYINDASKFGIDVEHDSFEVKEISAVGLTKIVLRFFGINGVTNQLDVWVAETLNTHRVLHCDVIVESTHNKKKKSWFKNFCRSRSKDGVIARVADIIELHDYLLEGYEVGTPLRAIRQMY